MSDFDFDAAPSRRGTDSLKWDKYAGRDILPLWVADMDFPSPPAVAEALAARVEHGVFGYARPPGELPGLVVERLGERYGWSISPEWLLWLPGGVVGLNLAVRAFAPAGGRVLIPTPIYPPFLKAPEYQQAEAVQVPLCFAAGRWSLDFSRLEAELATGAALVFFCNPHNPVGRVFTRDEVIRLVELCAHYRTPLCSDELHCDLLLDPQLTHHPAAAQGMAGAKWATVLMSPSKIFNVAGLGCSFFVVPDSGLRRRLRQAQRGLVPDVNLLAWVAARAAYGGCADWEDALRRYLAGTRDYLERAINAIPGLQMHHHEASYLAWIRVADLKLEDPPGFFEAAGVGMSPGADFAHGDFMRLNFGCPRALVEEGVRRLQRALPGGWRG